MTPSTAPPGFTILRIKRKITEDPLESLLIDDSYRPKKRTRDVSQQSKGVFRLADTVGESWEEQEGGEALRSKIARLVSSQQQAPSAPSPASPPPTHTPQPQLRYRIIAPPSQPRPSSSRRAPQAPPIIKTTPDPSLPPPLKYIDAHQVIVSQSSKGLSEPQRGGNHILPPSGLAAGEEEDPDVAAFLPMLREYLAVFNPVPSSSSTSATSSQAPTPPPPQTPSAPDQYVYDLYYHSTTAPAAELAAAAAATVEGYVAEGEEELMAESDSDAESDEVDEDSNDEDFYRNDYPEEEAFDSEDSYGDGVGSADERGDW